MGRIFYIMGKSSSGKDTLYRKVQEEAKELHSVTLYTTRPIREGEVDGKEYYFVDEERCRELCEASKVIELRAYNTIHGVWKYFTVDDEQIHLEEQSYLMIGTLESYEAMCQYFGNDIMVPVYIHVDDGIRLERALKREQQQKEPKYLELCRRFLADAEDFSEEKLGRIKMKKVFHNVDSESCMNEILLYIKEEI